MIPPITKIISGDQTGVDRAGLDWAIKHGVPHGGRRAAEWIRAHSITVLNVAGPRESKRPGIYQMAVVFLDQLFPAEPVT